MRFRSLLPLMGGLLALMPQIASGAPSDPRVNWSPCYREFGPFE